jgi:hypothetical protein
VRVLPTIIVVVLLAGTAAAFAIAERLKLEPSPITGTEVDKVFSPVCECVAREARISFRLRRADTLTVSVLDDDNRVVRTLVGPRRYLAGPLVFFWNGRGLDGEVVPEAAYHPRVELARNGRTIVLPNPIRVDVTPPRVLVFGVSPRVLSPNGDGRADKLEASYRLSERATPTLFVDGKRRVRGRFQRPVGKLNWYGQLRGKPVPEGTYAVTLVAEDPAGNRSRAAGPDKVRVRYVDLRRHRIIVRAGLRFGVRVDTDAASVRWRLGRRGGSSPAGLLRLRAPLQPGRYTLVVAVGEHFERAAVFVRRR